MMTIIVNLVSMERQLLAIYFVSNGWAEIRNNLASSKQQLSEQAIPLNVTVLQANVTDKALFNRLTGLFLALFLLHLVEHL